MRPDLLNPLFVELTAVKGVGATLGRQLARLKLGRVVDLLFHLPAMAIDRVRLDAVDEAYVDRTVTVAVTPMTYEAGALRRPFKVNARDAAGTWLALAYFGGGGAYAKTLLPLGSGGSSAAGWSGSARHCRSPIPIMSCRPSRRRRSRRGSRSMA